MSWLVSAKQYIPAVIGEPFGGGYFAGYISHTANGVPTHALIVAPRATGATGTGYTLTTNLAWKTANTTTTGTTSSFDGAANTAAMVTAGIANHPAAQFCVNLNIGGFTDWYLPAPLELEIAYFNLKPGTTANNVSYGTNIYAIPQRNSNYASGSPTQTSLTAWQATGGSESFVQDYHYASREGDTTYGVSFRFSDGLRNDYFSTGKISPSRIRAFRRIAL